MILKILAAVSGDCKWEGLMPTLENIFFHSGGMFFVSNFPVAGSYPKWLLCSKFLGPVVTPDE